MKLLRLLRNETSISYRFLFFIAAISGLANTLVLVSINMVSGSIAKEGSSLSYILFFAAMILTYFFSQKYLLVTTAKNVEEVVYKMRLRIMDKIQDAEFQSFERIGKSRIYASVSKELQMISEASLTLTMAGQSGITTIFALGYIAWQSILALVFFIAIIAIAIIIYLRQDQRLKAAMHESLARENELFDTLTDLLDGFKEVKMSELRGTDLNEHIKDISASVVDLKYEVSSQVSFVAIFTQASFYILVASLVFILPLVAAFESAQLVKLVSVVLFLIAPLSILVSGMQLFTTANVAAENIENLEDLINQHVRSISQRCGEPLVFQEPPFREIKFDDVHFNYVDEDGLAAFHLGPIDLSISRGETIFVSGGNGSGKSTFLHLLTCLYFPTQGVLSIDDQPLAESNAEDYRELFSVIFFDYHLFDRLYGIRDIEARQDEIDELLERLQLHEKTSLIDHRFETLNLSSGQKRRLALLIHYLEDNPICVFDEWAAEQEPEYRRYFYTDILPELKANGKTTIVVTHDDRYYNMDYVDRILKFEEGRLISDEPVTSADPS